MESALLQRLQDKTMTKEELLQKVKEELNLLPEILNGVNSSKPAIRYGCANVLMDLSGEYPENLYPYMDSFIKLLSSNHRILVWNSIIIIANLAKVDKCKKFDAVFDQYFCLLDDGYMVTVANIVGHSSKIALAKPYLIQRITNELLRVENISTTNHLTDECKRVIAEKTITTLGMFFEKIDDKKRVISFVARQIHSPRKALRVQAQDFLSKFS